MKIKHWTCELLQCVSFKKKNYSKYSHFQSCRVFANLELHLSLAKLKQAKRGTF